MWLAPIGEVARLSPCAFAALGSYAGSSSPLTCIANLSAPLPMISAALFTPSASVLPVFVVRVLEGSSIEGYRERIVTGPILSSMVRLGLPLMLTNIIFLFYNLTDAFWLSRFSPLSANTLVCYLQLFAGSDFP